MNREQRRAALKNINKKFAGFDIDNNILTIPVKRDGYDVEKLTLNLNDLNTYNALYNLYDLFANIEETYKADFAYVEQAGTEMEKVKLTMQIYTRIIKEFSESLDALFGEGSTEKIFGVKLPMPQALSDFLDGLAPVLQVMQQAMSLNEAIPSQVMNNV